MSDCNSSCRMEEKDEEEDVIDRSRVLFNTTYLTILIITFTTQSLHDHILFVKQIYIDISGRRFAAIIISSTSSVFSGRNPTVFPFSGFKFIKILVFHPDLQKNADLRSGSSFKPLRWNQM
ncbi:unnamed protein product [Lactuca saligna]|uniref:Uncharacterized protein n=1 Tax=Lactuca saligna TaxID=75948 RepID=A0AA35Z723_LACSI|nr:unnamed protein product [Lactuca saligna]